MYCITDRQIDYILDDIRRNGIEMEDLQLNLLDHICCIIEQELKEDDDFERFYQRTVQQFYKKNLHEIEEETINLLTFKNFYQMKKLMITGGAFTTFAFMIGSFFKIMHWPGASVILVLAFGLFSFLFLPLLFILKTKELQTVKDKWVLGIGTIVGILYCMSMLFQVMHWPGARVIWLTTLCVSFFILIPLYLFAGARNPETRTNTIVTTILLMGFLGVQFTLTSIRSKVPQTQVYTFIKNEALLKDLQSRQTVKDDKLAADINASCERIKSLILSSAAGRPSLPWIPGDVDVHFDENNLGMSGFGDHEDGLNLLSRLNEQVNAYNAARPDKKLPTDHSIINAPAKQVVQCNNLYALNNLTQIQLFLAAADANAGLAQN